MKMKDIRIESLYLEHFKAVDYLSLEGGKQKFLVGGATVGTVLDAFSWVLYGKDRNGKVPEEVRPLTEKGYLKDPVAVTEVTAVLDVNGEFRKFRRSYHPIGLGKWQESCYADGIPCSALSFQQQVEALIPENQFYLLQDPLYFAEKIPWQQRRALLADMIPMSEEIRSQMDDARYENLLKKYPQGEMEKALVQLRKKRKELLKCANDLPLRIAECTALLKMAGIPNFCRAGKRHSALWEERDQALSAEQPDRERIRKLNEEIETLSMVLMIERFKDHWKDHIQALRRDMEKTRYELQYCRCEEKDINDYLDYTFVWIEGYVQKHFPGLGVKLTDDCMEGIPKPLCALSYRGIPWGNLSGREKKEAFLILRPGLTSHLGLRLPLFAESWQEEKNAENFQSFAEDPFWEDN